MNNPKTMSSEQERKMITPTIGMGTKFSWQFLVSIAPIVFFLIVGNIQLHQILEKQRNDWTVSNMAVWSQQFQNDNPTSKVPEPFKIKHLMEPGFVMLKAPLTTAQLYRTP